MRNKHSSVWISGLLGLVLGACDDTIEEPALVGPQAEDGETLVIPVDDRTAIRSEIAPPPISGGTLLVTSDGSAAIVSDPDRDIVSIVSIVNGFNMHVAHTIALGPGDRPGRAVEDSSGRVHIALRGAGAIVTVDVVNGLVLRRRAVCKAPRGIAYDEASGLLHVACAEGKLVTLPAEAGDVLRTVFLPADLRDVLVRGADVWVTRFKSAEVLRVDAQHRAERSGCDLGRWDCDKPSRLRWVTAQRGPCRVPGRKTYRGRPRRNPRLRCAGAFRCRVR